MGAEAKEEEGESAVLERENEGTGGGRAEQSQERRGLEEEGEHKSRVLEDRQSRVEEIVTKCLTHPHEGLPEGRVPHIHNSPTEGEDSQKHVGEGARENEGKVEEREG